MARSLNITSADAKAVLTVEDLYPQGIELQQFSTDAAAVADAIQTAETRMGVDGYMAAGYTPNIKVVTVTLEANSESRFALNRLYEATENNRKPYLCSLTIKINATGETYKYSVGVLQSAGGMPGLNRVLAPTSWVFHFERLEINA